MAELALAWILSRRWWIVPIPGITKLHRLEEHIGPVEVSCISDEWQTLNKCLEKIEIHGA